MYEFKNTFFRHDDKTSEATFCGIKNQGCRWFITTNVWKQARWSQRTERIPNSVEKRYDCVKSWTGKPGNPHFVARHEKPRGVLHTWIWTLVRIRIHPHRARRGKKRAKTWTLSKSSQFVLGRHLGSYCWSGRLRIFWRQNLLTLITRETGILIPCFILIHVLYLIFLLCNIFFFNLNHYTFIYLL